MSWLKSTGVSYTLCDETFELAFSQNVMEAILERFGSRSAFLQEFNGTLPKQDKKKSDQADNPDENEQEPTEEEQREKVAEAAELQKKAAQLYRTVMCILLNDAIEERNRNSKAKLELVTEQQLGRVLRVKDYDEMRNLIVHVWNVSNDIVPSTEDDDEEDIDAGELPEEPEKN